VTDEITLHTGHNSPPYVTLSLGHVTHFFPSRKHTQLCCFFFNDTATTEIYTLSHTTLFRSGNSLLKSGRSIKAAGNGLQNLDRVDRKSTRLNSSHGSISYAVFCLKKKNTHGSVEAPHT